MAFEEGDDPLTRVARRWFVVGRLRCAPDNPHQCGKLARIVFIEEGVPGIRVLFHVVFDAESRQRLFETLCCATQGNVLRTVTGTIGQAPARTRSISFGRTP